MAVLTLAGAIAGSVSSELLDYFKTEHLRRADARIKAVEIGWNQSVDAFQRLFGLRAKLRADIWSYRDAELYTKYHAAAFNLSHDKRDDEREVYYRHTIDDYAMRVVDDRAQMQALLGWFDYVLPQQKNPIAAEMKDLIQLDPWYPEDPPGNTTRVALDKWLKDERTKADDAAAAEINRKFDALQFKLKKYQQEILSEPTRRYIAMLNETDR
ncbi:MAG: hypothetical protein QOF63_2324 [Thermoanaerobaculia bacterium]|jgi:hypothetical protein|nr:hypothetical protein [Thermoanaerobaculia bacterium]